MAGEVAWANYSTSPLKAIRAPGGNSAAQKAGKRYEAKVLKKFDTCGFGKPVKSPWIHFGSPLGIEKHCQPDALLFRRNYLVVFEIKLTHTLDAYWQLRKLYQPVVQVLEPGYPIHLVEITRSFDPALAFPEEMQLFFSLEELLLALDTTSGDIALIHVLQWKL